MGSFISEWILSGRECFILAKKYQQIPKSVKLFWWIIRINSESIGSHKMCRITRFLTETNHICLLLLMILGVFYYRYKRLSSSQRTLSETPLQTTRDILSQNKCDLTILTQKEMKSNQTHFLRISKVKRHFQTNSFFPRTATLWNRLTDKCFPED